MKEIKLNLAVATALTLGAVFLMAAPAAAQCWWCEHCWVTPSGGACCGGHLCCV